MSDQPSTRPRRSRKSIAFQPNAASETPISEPALPRPSRKSRSKSLGPGGLEELNSAAAKTGALKASNGNGRRESIASGTAAAVKSILKPTLPLSPLQPIPAHKGQTPKTEVKEKEKEKEKETKPQQPPASVFQLGPAAHNQTMAIPVKTEEEQQQKRAEILAKRAARRQSLGNRRVSFAPEATLHTWDVEYNVRGEEPPSTPASSMSSGSRSSDNTREQLPTSPELPSHPPSTPPTVGGPASPDGLSSSPYASSTGEDAFISDGGDSTDSMDDDDDDDGLTMGDPTFQSVAGTEMGDDTRMTLGVDTEMLDETVRQPFFKKPVMWRFEGETNTIGSSPPAAAQASLPRLPGAFDVPAEPEEEEEEEEEEEKEPEDMTMDMDMTRAVGGIKSIEYPDLPAEPAHQDSEEESEQGEDMTMDMTMAVGGIINRNATPKRTPPPLQDEETPGDMTMDVGMDMDFTRPIGGIVSNKSAAVSSPASSDAGDEGMTMEFTSVLGGILGSRQQKAEQANEEQRMLDQQLQNNQDSDDDEGDAMDMTMDMTMAVGGIIKNQFPQAPQNQESEDEDNDEPMEMTMDMTTAIGGILSAPKEPTTSPAKAPAPQPPKTFKEKLLDIAEQAKAEEAQPRRRSTRRSSGAPAVVPERRSARKATPQQEAIPQEPNSSPLVKRAAASKTATPKAATPKAAAAKTTTPKTATKAATPKAPTPQAPTPKAAIPKATTPKAATPKPATPKQKTPPPVATPTVTITTEAGSPVSVTKQPAKAKTPTPQPPTPQKLVTPQRQQTTPQHLATPHNAITPPQQVTPAQPIDMPKTPSKSTPRIDPKVLKSGVHDSAKKRLGFQSSPLRNSLAGSAGGVKTPQGQKTPLKSTPTHNIFRPGVGSPAVAEKLRRLSLNQAATPIKFTPVKLPGLLLSNSKKDDEERAREEAEEKQRKEEEFKKMDLRRRISVMGTPKKTNLRMNLAVGAMNPGKRSFDFDDEDSEESRKRRKSADGSVFDMDGREELTLTGVNFQHVAPQMEIKTPRKTPKKVVPPPPPPSSPPVAVPMDIDEQPEPEPTPVKKTQKHVQILATKTESVEEVSGGSMEEAFDNITLDEFLEMIDISFLDDLNATKRRQTGFMPRRDSDVMAEDHTFADVISAGVCTVPMLDLAQHSCRELRRYIKDGRKVITEIAKELSESNPTLFREYITAPTDVKFSLKNQFKDMKTFARLQAKETWYGWRTNLFNDIITLLEGYLADLKGDMELLQKQKGILDPALPEMEKRVEELKSRVEKVREYKSRIAQDDPELLSSARSKIITSREKITQLKIDLETNQNQLDTIESELADSRKHNAAMIEAIEESERIKEQNRGWSEEEVASWKEKCDALERESGWCVAGAGADGTLELLFKRQLAVTVDPTGSGKRAPTVRYVALEDPRPSQGRNLSDIEREFFVTGLTRRLAKVESPKEVLQIVAGYWTVALEVSGRIQKLRNWYPTETRMVEEGKKLEVGCTVLVRELRTKMKIGFLVGAGTLRVEDSRCKVVYGGVDEEVAGRVLREWTGEEWREGVRSVVEGIVGGRRRGGRRVSVKG